MGQIDRGEVDRLVVTTVLISPMYAFQSYTHGTAELTAHWVQSKNTAPNASLPRVSAKALPGDRSWLLLPLTCSSEER